MAEVVLDEAEVMALVGEVVAAGVAERVRVEASQAGALGCDVHQVADGLPGEWLTALRQEQLGQVALPRCKVAPGRAQFVAGNGLLDGQPALEAMHPHHGAVQVQLVQPQADRLADA